MQGQFGVWEIDGLYEDFTGMKSPEFLYGLVQSEDSQFISLQEVSRRICDSGVGEKFIIPQVSIIRAAARTVHLIIFHKQILSLFRKVFPFILCKNI